MKLMPLPHEHAKIWVTFWWGIYMRLDPLCTCPNLPCWQVDQVLANPNHVWIHWQCFDFFFLFSWTFWTLQCPDTGRSKTERSLLATFQEILSVVFCLFVLMGGWDVSGLAVLSSDLSSMSCQLWAPFVILDKLFCLFESRFSLLRSEDGWLYWGVVRRSSTWSWAEKGSLHLSSSDSYWWQVSGLFGHGCLERAT